MNGQSLNIEQDNLAKLKEQFPNLFTEGKPMADEALKSVTKKLNEEKKLTKTSLKI